MPKLVEFYKRDYSWDPARLRIWRTNFYLARMYGRRWYDREIGFSASFYRLSIYALVFDLNIVFWAHRDNCDCDKCLPF